MTKDELLEDIKKKETIIMGLQKQIQQHIVTEAALRNEITEQNYYISKLQARLMETGSW